MTVGWMRCLRKYGEDILDNCWFDTLLEEACKSTIDDCRLNTLLEKVW
jgi:hypothetical protein